MDMAGIEEERSRMERHHTLTSCTYKGHLVRKKLRTARFLKVGDDIWGDDQCKREKLRTACTVPAARSKCSSGIGSAIIFDER